MPAKFPKQKGALSSAITPPAIKFDHKATIPAGTLIQVNGVPFRVTNRTQIEGSLDALKRAGVK